MHNCDSLFSYYSQHQKLKIKKNALPELMHLKLNIRPEKRERESGGHTSKDQRLHLNLHHCFLVMQHVVT